MKNKIKTLKGWDEINLDLHNYLGDEPCEIDEDLNSYIGECVAPAYVSPQFIQGCDAYKIEDGVPFYITTSNTNNKYYYLGVLPQFL